MEQKLTIKVTKIVGERINMKTKQTLKKTLDTTLLDKISSKGLLEEPEYSLPMHDTLGQRYYNISRGKLENS